MRVVSIAGPTLVRVAAMALAPRVFWSWRMDWRTAALLLTGT